VAANPEIDQDRVFDLFDTYKEHGVVMFHQQRRIYEFVASNLSIINTDVLEAGCGNGVGSIILEGECNFIVATDKLQSNIAFARQLYPHLDFRTWDINLPWCNGKFDTVVCIEAFEHVANPLHAMWHLMEAATKEVWLSTPNGIGKPRPPENPFHCLEYTPLEMLEFVLAVNKNASVTIHECDTFSVLGTAEIKPEQSPLLYHIELPQ
jgi:2-polyprenyl-3-methyl-5-hydroxy-6-metoxy-1,4-benzoquinol methylase